MVKQPLSIKTQGMKVLRRRLSVLDAGFDDLKELHEDVAKIVAFRASQLAPIGKTKELRDTIRASGTKTAGRVRAGFKSVPYAGPVHFGWATRPDFNKGWQGGPILPNPFLYDALDERHNEVFETYFKGVKKIQKKAGL
tara:strand:- start:2199 stop:2615 length:417 start_codon:yes stop_codon:yes gene_type:complete